MAGGPDRFIAMIFSAMYNNTEAEQLAWLTINVVDMSDTHVLYHMCLFVDVDNAHKLGCLMWLCLVKHKIDALACVPK